LNQLIDNSQLKLARVAITAKQATQYLGVVSSDWFSEVVSQRVNMQIAGSITVAYQPPLNLPLSSFVTPAYAAWYDIDWEGVLETAVDYGKEAISWVVPYEDIAELGRQLYYLSTGNDKDFKPELLLTSALGTISVIPTPATKPFKLVSKGLNKLFRKINPKSPFVRALAGTIGKVAKRCWDKRSFEDLQSMAGFMALLADFITHMDEYEEELKFFISTVQNSDHLLAWIDLFAMPLGGALGEVLSDDDFAYLDNQPYEPWYASAVSVVIPKAYAKDKKKKSLVDASRAVKILQSIKEISKKLKMKKAEVSETVKGVVSVFNPAKTTGSTKKIRGRVAEMREYLFTPPFWKAAIFIKKYLGLKGMRGLLKGAEGLRTSVRDIIIITSYIGMNIEEGKLSHLKKGILGKLKPSFPDSDTQDINSGVIKTVNSEIFHLGVLVSYSASGFRVEGIESNKNVRVYMGDFSIDLDRKVDLLVLQNDFELWVEVKSYEYGNFCSKSLQNLFDVTAKIKKRNQKDKVSSATCAGIYKFVDKNKNREKTTAGNPRRQFFLDRSHGGVNNFSDKVQWVFHGFNKYVKKRKGYAKGYNNRGDIEKIVRVLTPRMKNMGVDINKQFGLNLKGNSYIKNWKKYNRILHKDLGVNGWHSVFKSRGSISAILNEELFWDKLKEYIPVKD
ncbi:hypothetical protein, partial [Zooshikella harenae]